MINIIFDFTQYLFHFHPHLVWFIGAQRVKK